MPKYIGWVPTLIGNLSYTLAGRSNYPYKPKVCIFEYNQSFHYLISQTRITHDSQLGLSTLIPFKKIAKKFEAFVLKQKGYVSIWEPILIGTCSQNTSEDSNHLQSIVGKNFQTLEGEIIFIPRIPQTSKLINSILTAIKEAGEHLSFRNDFDPSKAFEVKEALQSEINNIKVMKNRGYTLLSCRFELYRNGLCYLSDLKKLEQVALEDARFNPSSKQEENEPPELNDLQAYNQVFYFIKDVFHSHKFHNPDYDTLTQAYEFIETDSSNWAKETLKDFYRTAIRIEPEESLGILYYARAFKDIIKNDQTLNISEEQRNDGFSFLDGKTVSDKYAEDVCKVRIEGKKRDLDARKWQAGLLSTAFLLIWRETSTDLIKLLGSLGEGNSLLINIIVPFFVAWLFLIYVKKVSLSKWTQMIKLVKYLSSIRKLYQILTLSIILLFGLFLALIVFL